MKVIMKKPGEAPVLTDITNELSALQEAVGGLIETFTFAEDACVICNEEGKLMGLPYNCTFLGEVFVGTILIVGVAGEEFADVPEDVSDFLMGGLLK